MTNKQITDLVILNQIMKEKNESRRNHQLNVFLYNKSVEKEKKPLHFI